MPVQVVNGALVERVQLSAAEEGDDVFMYGVAVVGQCGGGEVELSFAKPLGQLCGNRTVSGQVGTAELLLGGVLGTLRQLVGLESAAAHLAAPPVRARGKVN